MRLLFAQTVHPIENHPGSVTYLGFERGSFQFANMLRSTLLTDERKLVLCGMDLLEGVIERDEKLIEHLQSITPEELLDRLVQIPLVPVSGLIERDDCDCKSEGCARCQVVYRLSVYEPRMILSGELRPEDQSNPCVVYPRIPIVELVQGEFLDATLYGRLRRASENANFRSTTVVAYRPFREVRPIGEGAKSEFTRLSIVVASLDQLRSKVNIEDVRPGIYQVRINAKPTIIEVYDTNHALLTVETDGAVEGMELLAQCFDTLIPTLQQFEQTLGELAEIPIPEIRTERLGAE